MKNPTISYAILACVELPELEKLLPFLKEWKKPDDEIVILLDDICYTAGVEEIAFKYADRVKHRSLDKDFASQKNALIDMCEGDYIFNIDADELPSKYIMANLHDVIHENSNVDVFWVPRINTVDGITDEHVHEWRWRVNDHGWVNWPDWQMRIFRNNKAIRWKNAVHEILSGYKMFTHLPEEPDWAILHHKTIDKQEQQNAFYSSI